MVTVLIPDVIVDDPRSVTTGAVTVATPVATVSFSVVVIVLPGAVTVATPVATVLPMFSVTVLPDAVTVVYPLGTTKSEVTVMAPTVTVEACTLWTAVTVEPLKDATDMVEV